MKYPVLTLLALSCFAFYSQAGFAQSDTTPNAVQGGAFDSSRFQIRLRGIGIFADGGGRVVENGLKTDVGNAVTPELDISYFFTDHLAAELIAATAEHEVDAGAFNLGNTMILPPTLTLQYHFMPEKKFSPYIGAGLNYSVFYGEKDGTGFSNLDVKNGVGYAVQAGFDYWLNDNWGLNFDAKYIDLDVDVSVDLGATNLNAKDVDIDPLIIGTGISYRF